MTDSQHADARGPRGLRVLLYSDDRTTRDAVRVGVGRRPAKDIAIESWRECATPAAVVRYVEDEEFDVLILDGEANPFGGLGLCKQLKHEVRDCPPVIVLTGRPDDAWLASWSGAEGVVAHPLDPIALASTVAEVGRLSLAAPRG